LLVEMRRRARERAEDEEAFDAAQNAEVAADAEHYYRIVVRGERESWNIRDHHMADTVDRLAHHLGPRSKDLVWEHDSHIGDAWAMPVAREGLINVSQLVRERHDTNGWLCGLSLASRVCARRWSMGHAGKRAPGAVRPRGQSRGFPRPRAGPASRYWCSATTGLAHGPPPDWATGRSASSPSRSGESRNYVPTRMGDRYDTLIWFEQTEALRPLHHEAPLGEPEFETAPTGF
jgi:erythromycin esterase-like protein